MIAIYWTPESETTFARNLEYLAGRWNNKVAIDFIRKVDGTLKVIASNPEAFPYYNESLNIRCCVITPQITVYYRIVDNKMIDLLTFWNNYQNPAKLKLG